MEHSASERVSEIKSFISTSSKETIIHPTAIIEKTVRLGQGVTVGPFAVISGNTTIGDGVHISSHAIIGSSAQSTGITTPLGSIFIGEKTIIKEFVTIGSSRFEDGATRIGRECFLMNYAHVAHDCVLEDRVELTNNVQLGGHTHIEHDVRMMANAATHQRCRIGAYSAVAPYAGTRQDLPPFCLFNEVPAKFAGLNKFKLKQANIPQESIENLRGITRLFYQEKSSIDAIIAKISNDPLLSQDRYVQQFIGFVQESQRGVSRKRIGDS